MSVRACILVVITLGPASARAQWDGEVATAAPAGRLDADAMLLLSIAESYHSYTGGLVEVTYALLDTLSVGVAIGLVQGTPERIVTGSGGIIYNHMLRCLSDAAQCTDIDPNLPWAQVTGILDGVITWTPLRLDALDGAFGNIELYALVGVGVHGTRELHATAAAAPVTPDAYTIEGGDFGDGGFLSRSRVHLTVGGGVRLIFLDLIAVRAELRSLFWRDEYDLGEGPDSYGLSNHFVSVGLGVAL